MSIVGFSGSQTGVTKAQLIWLNYELHAIGMTELHHGACIGADAAAHMIALEYFTGSTGDGIPELPIVIHPPENMSKVEMRCLLRDQEIVRVLPRKPYLVRNRDIVNASNILLATPDGPERLRSGTWATIRYARDLKHPIKICYPNGEVEPLNLAA